MKPFECYKYNWKSNSSVTWYGAGKLHDSWTGKSTENNGSFPRVTFVSGLKIRELGEVMDCQVSYLRRCWGMSWIKVNMRPQHRYPRFCYISKVRHNPVRVWVPDQCSCSLTQHNKPPHSFPVSPDATKMDTTSVGILCSCRRCWQSGGCYKSTGDPHHWPVGCDK